MYYSQSIKTVHRDYSSSCQQSWEELKLSYTRQIKHYGVNPDGRWENSKVTFLHFKVAQEVTVVEIEIIYWGSTSVVIGVVAVIMI